MSDVTDVFDYDTDDGDSCGVARDSKRGLYIACEISETRAYASCPLPDAEALRLAIALIQATPGEADVSVDAVGLDAYVQTRTNVGGTVDVTAFNRYGDPCSTAELRSDGMIALACALIRAAGKR